MITSTLILLTQVTINKDTSTAPIAAQDLIRLKDEHYLRHIQRQLIRWQEDAERITANKDARKHA